MQDRAKEERKELSVWAAADDPADPFTASIAHKDQIKLINRKKAMLKEAVYEERRKRSLLTEELTKIQDKIKRYETDCKKKQEKNEALIQEIRTLKDLLITQRNEKQAIVELLSSKTKNTVTQQGTKQVQADSSRYFGLSRIFEKK